MTNHELYTTFLGCVLLFAIGVGSAFAKEAGTGETFSQMATQSGDSRLTGYWIGSYGAIKITIGFLPDGRYFSEVKESDDAQPERETGQYQVSGNQLIIKGRNGTQNYDFRLAGNKLTLSGGIFDEPITFVKKSGSETEIAEDMRQTNANENKENDAWRQRIPVAPLTKRSSSGNGGVGDLPKDPNPSRIFQKPTVFTELEVYLKLGAPQTMVFSDGSRRGVFNETNWYFFPEGRVFVRSVLYRENGPAKGQVVESWGRYTVQPGGEEEAVTVEFDSGEKHILNLIDGRRNLQWDNRTYGNLKWEQDS